MKFNRIGLICLLIPVIGFAQRREIDLRGQWRFEIGDRDEYADTDYDDSKWETIRVPGRWEDQGFPGYDGYAWYRKSFTLSRNLQDKVLSLHLGRIDDCDRVYLNGQLLNGAGGMPPNYLTAYSVNRVYPLPAEMLRFGGLNIIAIQVYDEVLEGGILDGDPRIESQRDALALSLDLAGPWKFNIGDDLSWKEINFIDTNWQNLQVPVRWDYQGFADYDGYAWYRKKVVIGRDLQDERLILSLGKIDDADEVYFNGERIGHTGDFPAEERVKQENNFYYQERLYTIPGELVRWNSENVIAVRVYDVWRDGGIYEGRIGITTRTAMLRYKKDRVNSFGGLLQWLFEGDWD